MPLGLPWTLLLGSLASSTYTPIFKPSIQQVAAFPDDEIAGMSLVFWSRLAQELTGGYSPQPMDGAWVWRSNLMGLGRLMAQQPMDGVRSVCVVGVLAAGGDRPYRQHISTRTKIERRKSTQALCAATAHPPALCSRSRPLIIA